MDLLAPGDLRLPALVAVALVLGFILEALFMGRGARWYYAAGAPLRPPLVPYTMPSKPHESGTHAGIHWRRIEPGMVVFWADRQDRRVPTMLHGLALERQRGEVVHLDVRWAPPWTPLLAACWLMVLGLLRGEAQLTVPIGIAMIVALGILYHRGARGAAASLRFALQQEAESPPEG